MTMFSNEGPGLIHITAIVVTLSCLVATPPILAGVFTGLSGLLAHATLAFFWTGAIGLLIHAERNARTRLRIDDAGDAILETRTLFRRRLHNVRRREIVGIDLVETRDHDGAPYYRAHLVLADGRTVVLAEGHRRQNIEVDMRRARSALGLCISSNHEHKM